MTASQVLTESYEARKTKGIQETLYSWNCGPRAVKYRLAEPGQIIPQHGCVPALPASVSPGSGNFSRKSTKVVGAAQNQASVITPRGLEVKLLFYFRSREKYFS